MKKILSHCFLPILIGGVIYTTFRGSNLLFFKWIHVANWINDVSLNEKFKSNYLFHSLSWVANYFPDGLWAYAFTSALILFWGNGGKEFKAWIYIPFSLGVLSELFQFLKLIPGTFDFLDIIAYLFGSYSSTKFLNYKPYCHEK